MKNKKLVLTIIAIAVLMVSVIAGTYAFFTATVNDDTSDTVTVTSGSLSLTLNDMDMTSLTSWVITPSDLSRTVYLSVTNNSPIDVYAKLLFKGLTNTYSEYLAYSLEQVNSNKTSLSTVKWMKGQARVPASVSASDQELANYLNIPAGQTYYYKLTIEYLYSTTVNQSSDVGKKFYTGFGLEEGIEPVRIISKAGSNLATGDKIAIGYENFWVISNTSGTVRALAEYNLYVGSIYDSNGNKIRDISNSEAGYGLQRSDAKGTTVGGAIRVGTVAFGSKYYSASLVKGFIDDYATLLNNIYETNVTGDAITKEELESPLECSGSSCSNSSYSWVYTTSYWTGTSASIPPFIYCVYSSGSFTTNTFASGLHHGVRPVITISESSF